jgi:Nitrile hydratase, alpha chain
MQGSKHMTVNQSAQLSKLNAFGQTYSQIVTRAWEEADFEQRLITNPREVLIEYNAELPKYSEIVVVKNTDSLFNLVLPARPSLDNIEAQLEIMQLQQSDADDKYVRIVERAWGDESFKQRFLAAPRSIFEEYKIEVPATLEVRIVENTHERIYLTLPAKPSGEISMEELELVAGGGWRGAFIGAVVGSAFGPIGAGVGAAIGSFF